MKTFAVILPVCWLAGNVLGQPAAPTVASLAAYSGSLQSPARVATDSSGRFYVTDPKAGQVVVLDAFGRRLAARSGLGTPLAIALDNQGQLLVSDAKAGSVAVFDPDWNLLFKLGAGDGEFQMPNHIAVAPASDTIYVADSSANVVKVYQGQSRVQQLGEPGTGPGQFNFPAGLCVSPAGEVFVVDQDNDRVQVFDSSGGFVRSFNLGTSTPSGRPQAALLDKALRLYVADTFQGTVKVFDPVSGTLLTSIGTFGESAGQLNSPGGLALDCYNRLCVASANNARLELYGLDGFLHVSTSQPPGVAPAGSSLVLTAVVGGEGPFEFQWQRNGQPIPGETGAALTMDTLAAAHSGGYSVVITSASGSVTSSVASFTVLAPPVILAGPENRTVLSGMEVIHTVQASGTDLAYQWFYNGLEAAGATEASWRLPNVQPHQAGEYAVRVSNLAGAAMSQGALLTVLAPPSQIEIVSVFTQPDRRFGLTLNVEPGYSYTLEGTTNFVHWQPLLRFANDAGLVDFVDAESTNYASRFYRVSWEP